MTTKVHQVIELLQALPPEATIRVTDVDDEQEFSIFSIESGAIQGTVDFVIQTKEEGEEE